jgi:hypothetical protein
MPRSKRATRYQIDFRAADAKFAVFDPDGVCVSDWFNSRADARKYAKSLKADDPTATPEEPEEPKEPDEPGPKSTVHVDNALVWTQSGIVGEYSETYRAKCADGSEYGIPTRPGKHTSKGPIGFFVWFRPSADSRHKDLKTTRNAEQAKAFAQAHYDNRRANPFAAHYERLRTLFPRVRSQSAKAAKQQCIAEMAQEAGRPVEEFERSIAAYEEARRRRRSRRE